MSARIIAGFPGIGKSFVARNSALSVRDSDSSSFSWRGTERHPDFPHNYVRHIQDHLNDYDVILVSSHAEVRDALREAGLAYTLVYPDMGQRDDYIERYIRRRSPASFIQTVRDRFDPWLAECRAETHPTHVVLARGQYLHDVLGDILSTPNPKGGIPMTTIGILGEPARLHASDIRRILDAEDSLTIEQSVNGKHDVHDALDMRNLVFYDDPFQDLDNRLVLPANIDRKKFERVLRETIDPNSMQNVERLVLINDIADINVLLTEFPEQFFDLDEHVGMYWWGDGIVIINFDLIRRIDPDEIVHGLWSTIAHELRHVLTMNPIIDDTWLTIEAGEEDNVEAYCRHIWDTRIAYHPDIDCIIHSV